jgi:2-oxoglutarate dehydrogenase E2 component (dihydrolipoamide succinyltransferase)
MSIAVVLPALGESVVEGTVAEWLVKEGDRVERDQPLVEVTTDKVDAEVPSPAAGVVERIVVAVGETVPVGAELARLEPRAPARRSSAPVPAADAVVPASEALPQDPPAAEQNSQRGPRATPLARRVAEALHVDLDGVTASGAAGRVTKRDVVRRSEGGSPAFDAVGAARIEPASPAFRIRDDRHDSGSEKPTFASYALQEGDRVIPMTPLRRLVADHMVYSKATSPHVGTVAEIDMGAVVHARDGHKRGFLESHGFSLSFLPFIVHATARALREYPSLNASVLDDAIVEKADLHIGVAVETDKGLVVPVVRHADRLSLLGLAQAIEDLASRARSKRLSADELRGGTFTVSNPGRDGNLYGFAIINQPQVAILRMGEIVKRPMVRTLDGQDVIAIRPTMHLALSYDHRAVDGSPANSFLRRIRQLLEDA